MMLWTPHKAIFRTQKISHKNGAMEIWDIWAKMGPFWDPGDPVSPSKVEFWNGVWFLKTFETVKRFGS